jgi:hypothetical protein
MATAVLRPHDALNSRMHLDAFAPPPTKPRRRRSPRPAAASSPPVPKMLPSRRSPPPKPTARKQPSPTRVVMEEVRILKRGEEPPAPAPAQAAAINERVIRSTNRIGPKQPAVAPRKVVPAPDVAVYAGPAFASPPEPSSLPVPGFCLRRAETEATRGLRCLLGIGQAA